MKTVIVSRDNNVVSIKTNHDDVKPTFRGWVIWFVAAVFYLYEYVLRASPSIMTEQLMQDFAITTTSLGVFSSMYYYAYTPLQIPGGLIVDRLGARLVITLSCILCFAGTFIFAYSDSLIGAQIGRFIIGAGSACAFLSTLKLVSEWFPPRYFAVLSGMTVMIGITTGGYVAGKPLALFVNALGWRQAMVWTAILGIIVTAFCWFIIRNTTKDTAVTAGTASTSTIIKDLGVLIRNTQTWYIALYGCLFYVTISVFAELWAVPYLMKKYGVDNVGASSISAMLFLGKGVGAPGIALLSNYLESRRKVMFISTLGATAAFLLAIYANVSISVMEYLLFFTGMCAGAQVLCFALNQEVNPHEISATSVGFTNTIVMLSGVVLLPILGALLDFNWDGQLGANGVRIYDINAYQTAMLSLPFCLFLSFVLVFFIKETYPHGDKK
ncbi:MAG: MFS transporter [Alphaproteobacteria bacterium]|nr:MFS transporter [Alphaproteobacteria bacterium]